MAELGVDRITIAVEAAGAAKKAVGLFAWPKIVIGLGTEVAQVALLQVQEVGIIFVGHDLLLAIKRPVRSDEIVVGAEAGFANGDAAIGNALDQFEGSLDAEIESFQIAIIHADDTGLGGERAVEFRGGVNFHQGLHFQLTAESD